MSDISPATGPGSGLDADTVDGMEASEIGISTSVPTDVSASRSFSTWYQNTGGSALLVYVSVDEAANNGPRARIQLHVNSSQVDNVVLYTLADGSLSRAAATGIIPDGGYYKVNTSVDNAMEEWQEAAL